MQRLIARILSCTIIMRLWRDISGISLIYVTVALPALIGVSLLAVDVGRLWSLQSSLQHAADSIALAAAGELDGRSDAITRASNAIAELKGNPAIFATSVATIDGGGVTPRYLRSLPASDALPIEATNVTTDPIEARFVEITVTPVDFKTLFPATFLGATSNTVRASATAVAGFQAAVCDFTPLFMCNPYEPQNGITDPLQDYGIYSHVQSIASKRRLISFKLHENGQWRSGDYGFLTINAGGENEDLGELIASVVPKSCFALKHLHTARSDEDDARRALNVRFDLYEGGEYGRSEYPPSVNVRKGYIVRKVNSNDPPDECDDNNPIAEFPQGELGTSGTYSPPNGVMGLPRDSDCTTGCSLASGRMGNGDWGGDTPSSDESSADFEQYWETNFSPEPPSSDKSGTPYSNSNLPTRYDIYRDEINRSLENTESRGVRFANSSNPLDYTEYKETGSPQCSPLAPVDEPDRRVIYGALINCRAVGMTGSEGGPYQGVAFGKFFMTEPVGEDGTLWVELIDIVEPGNSDQARDMVQLYR